MKLVLIPGTLCTQTLWQKQVNFLARFNTLEVEIFDITKQASIEEMSRELLASVSGDFYLAGFSLGTQVAFEIMKIAPERILKLALFSAVYGEITDTMRAGFNLAIETIQKHGLSVFLESIFQNYVPLNKADNLRIKKIYFEMAQSLGEKVALRQIKALLQNKPFTAFENIKCPTLLVCGSEDIRTTPEEHQKLAKSIQKSHLVIINNAGHFTLLEEPDKINTAMLEWLGL